MALSDATAYVLLEDGERFDGIACGADGHAVGEVVFTTGMTGYQEAMTDPSFSGQLITFTTAHVGNYGVSQEAMESDRIHARAAIMRAATNREDAPGAEGGWRLHGRSGEEEAHALRGVVQESRPDAGALRHRELWRGRSRSPLLNLRWLRRVGDRTRDNRSCS